MASPTAGQSSTRPDEGYSSSSDEENPEATEHIENEIKRFKPRGPPNRPAENKGNSSSHRPRQIKSQTSDQGVVPKKRTPAATSSQQTTADGRKQG